jgi:hypothetical protein
MTDEWRTDMYLWILKRSAGYGEVSELLIAAPTEAEARLLAVVRTAKEGYAADFARTEYSEITAVGEPVSGTDPGVMMVARDEG